ncbi:hypothetical protein BESB_010420 [Besnoitia besnoiti]|uniref:Transmembrane protein n=1 Tax=Besnoitia besnoiti TaxID=94643 RepID=A0A2A9MR04_BESBE|nr:hypothetical protein BESB_010420 [Besnoitia besnoiti]PFH38700.1 hypothetical protein BESB_010420 [Besnoitia besnoiti]
MSRDVSRSAVFLLLGSAAEAYVIEHLLPESKKTSFQLRRHEDLDGERRRSAAAPAPRGGGAVSTASTSPSSSTSSASSPSASTAPDTIEEELYSCKGVCAPPAAAADAPRCCQAMDVAHNDFGEDHSFSAWVRRLGTAVREALFHPAAVSPFIFHRACHASFGGDIEHDLGDLVPATQAASTAAASRRRAPLSCLTWSPQALLRTLQSGDALFAGLSLKGCLGEMLGTFLVAFVVHAAGRAASLHARAADAEGLAAEDFFFSGWGIAARLPLLLYTVGAVLGFFCNPAFLYAAYSAFARSPSACADVCDAARMNCVSVNLLAALHYIAAGIAAFIALALLPLDLQTAEAARKADLLGSQLAWLAITEALGACLMGAAVLQLLSLSSFFRASRQQACRALLTEARRGRGASGSAHPSPAALPTSSSLRRSFFSRSFPFFGTQADLASSFASPAPLRHVAKPPARAVALPLLLLLLTWALPPSRSSLNPAIAYTSNCARRQAGKFFFAPSGQNVGAQQPAAAARVVRAPGSWAAVPPATDSAPVLEVPVREDGEGNFIELESSVHLETVAPATSSSSSPSPPSSGEAPRHSESSSFVAVHANSPSPSAPVASSFSLEGGVVPFSLLEGAPEEAEAKVSAAEPAEDTGKEQEVRPVQALPASASRFFEEGEANEEAGGVPDFLLPPGVGEDKEEVEAIHVLNREGGDGEILFEFDEACATATPWFSFFLLFSAAPYLGALVAALLWKRLGGSDKQGWLAVDASLIG